MYNSISQVKKGNERHEKAQKAVDGFIAKGGKVKKIGVTKSADEEVTFNNKFKKGALGVL